MEAFVLVYFMTQIFFSSNNQKKKREKVMAIFPYMPPFDILIC